MKLKKVRKYIRSRKKKNNSGIARGLLWENAPDVKNKIGLLIEKLSLDWVIKERIFALRSSGTKSKAVARIWGLSKVWQKVLNTDPHYIIEVVSERYDKLKDEERNKVLLHELVHIPHNFSGALVPHYRRGKRKFNDILGKLINKYYGK